MNLAYLLLAGISLLLAAQAAYSSALMLYAWEDDEKRRQGVAPGLYEPPRHRFTLLLPARHEEAVIGETIRRVVDLDYPRDLVEVLVVIEAGDAGTIATVGRTLAALRRQGIAHVRLLTFADPPINKPHGLNVGLRAARGDVVAIFDAEDEPHPEILRVVDTVMARERIPAVQCGVQLMNYGDRWFSALNVLEYFFWFRSRLRYHARVGAIPLGGNTVFIRRDLLARLGGWDDHCLTEDADIGIRLNAAGVAVRVLYDDRYVTREETPPTTGQFLRQRTRWNQGYLQVLAKGDWRRLPTRPQRLLALYTLAFPLFQALTVLYLPVSLWLIVAVKMPVLVAILSGLPCYMLVLQVAVSLVGLYEFTGAHGLRPGPLSPARLVAAYLPYQWLLGLAAFRAVWRQARGVNTWEKTAHVGAHRRPAVAAPVVGARAEDTAYD